MKYAVSIDDCPRLCDVAFVMWDTEGDCGYDCFEFSQLIPGVSVFDNYDDAVDYAKEIFPEVSDCFNELCVVEINEADGEVELLWDSTTWQEEIEEGRE